ncbi:hypothetical protein [Microbacterium hydrocarbonoxydans]|uniref:Uncharacterized protein n=1 Tax=Microbacterium hydrocarbonoxydans TaxID=273678 RepID=A0A1H4J521_9MICO|nr:hypothetical protein [Microbacterium hydrocarbonoxydans]SEB40738.1 hypothetical protein SAMN04489807_0539 [Microbacterium hydrocarbonoxydans]
MGVPPGDGEGRLTRRRSVLALEEAAVEQPVVAEAQRTLGAREERADDEGDVRPRREVDGALEGPDRSWLSLPALALLVVGAIYEAFSLLYFVYPLQQWLLG